MNFKLKVPLCFFDLETTGTNISQDRIVEIAIIKVAPNGEVTEKSSKINPTIPIPIESSVVHGIYDKDVQDRPTFKEVAKEYARFLEGADLAGFNILKFDVPMLVEEFIRADVDFEYRKKKIIDSQRIFHMMEKRNLMAAYKFYCSKDLFEAHSAMADAKATMEVLHAQIEHYKNQEVTDGFGNPFARITDNMEDLGKLSSSNQIDLAGRMVTNGEGIPIFNFGKHKNKEVMKVLQEEPSYYDWIMKGDFPLDTKRRLTEIKLSQRLS
ncbi:MAG: 3'-5' exonuclease [Flammeovirgaceae bacterium]|nr:3'-5' exonuclease [Flammeovirgaceae bacterium]